MQRALSASRLLAPYCVPLFLEKLTSSYKVAKIDSLEGLEQAAAAYGSDMLAPFAPQIWQALKPELLPLRSAAAASAAAALDTAASASVQVRTKPGSPSSSLCAGLQRPLALPLSTRQPWRVFM